MTTINPQRIVKTSILTPNSELLSLLPDDSFVFINGQIVSDSEDHRDIEDFYLVDLSGIYRKESLNYQYYWFPVPSSSILTYESLTQGWNYTTLIEFNECRLTAIRYLNTQLAWFNYAKEVVQETVDYATEQIEILTNYINYNLGDFNSVINIYNTYLTHVSTQLSILDSEITDIVENIDYLNNLTGSGNTTVSTLISQCPNSVNLFPRSVAARFSINFFSGYNRYFGPFQANTQVSTIFPRRYQSLTPPSWKETKDYGSSDPDAKEITLSFQGPLGVWTKYIYPNPSFPTNQVGAYQTFLSSPFNKTFQEVFGNKVQRISGYSADIVNLNNYEKRHLEGLIDAFDSPKTLPLIKNGVLNKNTPFDVIAIFDSASDTVITNIDPIAVPDLKSEEYDRIYYPDVINTRRTHHLDPEVFLCSIFPDEFYQLYTKSSDKQSIQLEGTEKSIRLLSHNVQEEIIRSIPSSFSSERYYAAKTNTQFLSGVFVDQDVLEVNSEFLVNNQTGRVHFLNQGFPDEQFKLVNNYGAQTETVFRRGWQVTLPEGDSYSADYPSEELTLSAWSSDGYSATLSSTNNYTGWYWFGQKLLVDPPKWAAKVNYRRDSVRDGVNYYWEFNYWWVTTGHDHHSQPITDSDDPTVYNADWLLTPYVDMYKFSGVPSNPFFPPIDETPYTEEDVFNYIDAGLVVNPTYPRLTPANSELFPLVRVGASGTNIANIEVRLAMPNLYFLPGMPLWLPPDTPGNIQTGPSTYDPIWVTAVQADFFTESGRQ